MKYSTPEFSDAVRSLQSENGEKEHVNSLYVVRHGWGMLGCKVRIIESPRSENTYRIIWSNSRMLSLWALQVLTDNETTSNL